MPPNFIESLLRGEPPQLRTPGYRGGKSLTLAFPRTDPSLGFPLRSNPAIHSSEDVVFIIQVNQAVGNPSIYKLTFI